MNKAISIRDYIRDHAFGERAKESGTLVIYDPQRRYKDIALEMASASCRVIDASLYSIDPMNIHGCPERTGFSRPFFITITSKVF
jgi:hypothetical protein